ncbi:hypothetical protein DI53_2472 [Sphingobacterium deserti]|uniref:Uncharacterized protein n=2 Tax=Sphingobacterium deserti TaxID=1229276 RepID=A0A0B8T7N3_9SPHI|nr:hypothetical protein DI53_2472 [Sphingobacterium deserti]
MSFDNDPCNHLSTKAFLQTKYYILKSIRCSNQAIDKLQPLENLSTTLFTFHQAMVLAERCRGLVGVGRHEIICQNPFLKGFWDVI